MKTAPSLIVALDRALALEMPKYFQGTWCIASDTLKEWAGYEAANCQYNSVEIAAMKVSISALSVSCVVRQMHWRL